MESKDSEKYVGVLPPTNEDQKVPETLTAGDQLSEASFPAMTLSDGSTFFIDHIENGTLTSLDGAKAEGIEIGERIPVMIHVDADSAPQMHLDRSGNIEAILEPDGPTTMYTIHLTESSEGEKRGEETANLVLQEDLPFLPSPSKLEEFMDIVTTYKCKFCRFSCAWKSGLMSHIRSCHLEANGGAIVPKREDRDDSVTADSSAGGALNDAERVEARSSETVDDGKEEVKVQERHIFLCGQCSRGFPSLELCKKHMVKDHNLKLGRNGRKRIRKTEAAEFFSEIEIEDLLLDGLQTDRLPGKRKIRPPKALEDDFFLEQQSKKKRVRRDCVSDRTCRCTEKGCGYRFKTEVNLEYHVRCHTREEKAFACPECGERFEHWRGLVVHLWKQHSVDLDLYSCRTCDYKTYSLFKLDDHQRIHGDVKEFTCATCGKSFKQLSQLRNHHVIHLDRKNMSEKRWYSEQECGVCGRTFSDSKCLRKHQQAVHNKMKPYVCSYCGHTSARKAMLQLHVRQHTGEKPFLCEHCDYRTGDHNSLRRHRMRHTGTKPYKCPHCSYACIQAISYKTHLKNKHPGLEGLYACQSCTFRSVNKENYLNHVADHERGAIPPPDDPVATPAAQLHLPDSTLQQLEGILPGNVIAAHLIYNCLNALSQDGGASNLPAGVTTSSSGDGTQTITIQLPSESGDAEQYYFTVQQRQEGENDRDAVMLGGDGNDILTADEKPITV